jgi:hypothetical protein
VHLYNFETQIVNRLKIFCIAAWPSPERHSAVSFATVSSTLLAKAARTAGQDAPRKVMAQPPAVSFRRPHTPN